MAGLSALALITLVVLLLLAALRTLAVALILPVAALLVSLALIALAALLVLLTGLVSLVVCHFSSPGLSAGGLGVMARAESCNRYAESPNPTTLTRLLNPTKYRNIRTKYGGLTYDSKREAEVAQQLDLLRHARDPKERVINVERQFRIRLEVNGVKVADYVCDFLVSYADGRKELLEVKGYWTDVAKLKRKLFEATFLKDHPNINYRIVK